ncbi:MULTISPECIES: TetR/AcrR family transcriptional regulator C-terminal domain-containing protein [Streptomyces]|uniref:TetR/AcrR family transcriptional regulator C-terminal domain-containing protein n=1 Tax=Streptomyces sudanensis TaxID=436397 RepID=A0ABY4TE33_9ACTN|nr:MULTISPECIES: TetR/AcrR family transcriptional regulator C-terminal domain-containing protein [Streptomyces]MCP9987517.1 TetR/AcrR family transcriptional regulator C-terminal domain-containing protein [Streptomyces sudanensis]URN16691.1 TetR/AcrR family transcriptional regulator C-terminal domain-containing protein [Streptomyces sudanensis]
MEPVADSGGTGLTPGLEAAWGLRERPAKGPRPGLSVHRIVDVAVALAAAEGLAAVSMGRVAKKLGASTMSLYRHVASKDELYVLMLDAAIGAPPDPPPPGTGWRDALARWAWAQREMFQRNLWALHVPVSGPPVTPHSVAWWEAGMAAMADTPLDEGAKVSVVLLLGGFVRNETRVMADIGAAAAATGDTPEEVMGRYGRTLRLLADPGRYPAVARALESGIMDGPGDPDDEFRFGLARLLDGVQVLVERQRG